MQHIIFLITFVTVLALELLTYWVDSKVNRIHEYMPHPITLLIMVMLLPLIGLGVFSILHAIIIEGIPTVEAFKLLFNLEGGG